MEGLDIVPVMQVTHIQGSEAAASRSSSNNSTADRNKSYFTDEKKGEVSELMNLLKSSSLGRGPMVKRNVIKKVIAYMTLGIDVSRLFTQMVMAIETKDLVVKKMVYLYLCNYAASNSELAIMCINSLQRDCSNEDPMVRGLALRSLCGLRIASAVEYMIGPLHSGLKDSNSYVRKTAVIGVLRLFHFDRTQVENNGLVDSIYVMLNDTDQQVVTNCLYALQEIMADDGGMAVSQSMILKLLSRIEIFSEWGICQVIDLVTCYDPVDEEEMFTIMNLLDPVLRTNNSGVVLSAMKCFLHLTRHSPSLQDQVYERLKAPLLTLMAGGSTEIVHCILAHLDILIPRCPGLYDEDFRLFYVRDNEPQDIKNIKIKILSMLANPSNFSEIISELSEYVGDIDTGMHSRALTSIGHIAYRCPKSVKLATVQLVGFLDSSVPHVKAGAIIALQQLLTKYPDWGGDGIPRLRSVFNDLQDAEARAAAVWMVGHWGAEVPEAPYILEKIIDEYEDELVTVKRTLLTATVRLFFLRPPEVQAMLGRLLTRALNDVTSGGGDMGLCLLTLTCGFLAFVSRDIQDKALFYTRLLKTDAHAAMAIICADLPSINGEFKEDKDNPVNEAIFREFNSLSILYSKLSQDFILPQYQVKEGSSIAPLRVKELPEALSEGTGTAQPLEPNAASSSPRSGGGMLLDIGEGDTIGTKLVVSPTSSNYRATERHSPLGSGGGEAASCLNTTTSTFDLGSSIMNATTTADIEGGGIANLLSGMHEEEPMVATKDTTTIEEQHVVGGNDISFENLMLIRGKKLDPNHYQSLWAKLPESNYIENKSMKHTQKIDEVQHRLAKRHIYTMATGEDDKIIKLFLYCESSQRGHGLREAVRPLYLIQCNINKTVESYSIIVKSMIEDETFGQALAGIINEELNRAAAASSCLEDSSTIIQHG